MRDDLAHELLHDMARSVPDQLVKFGRALEAADGMPDGWPYFLERAEKWSHEYAVWVNAGEPDYVPDEAFA